MTNTNNSASNEVTTKVVERVLDNAIDGIDINGMFLTNLKLINLKYKVNKN